MVGQEKAKQHQAGAKQDAGQHARDQHVADGYGAACGQRVDHHVMAGRDENALAGSRHGEADGKLGLVALLFHHRHNDAAKGGNIRHGGAGDAAEEHGVKHVDVGKPAAEAADGQIGQVNDFFAHAAFSHDLAHQNKEGDGQQGKTVRALHHLVDHDRQVRSADQCADQSRKQHGKGDRHAQEH